MDKSKRDVGTAAEKTVENVKSGAAEKAMGQLDKKERREITDHSWLKQESVRYKEEVEILEAEVRMLEEQNLALMSYLFECRLEDLNISRFVLVNSFVELSNLLLKASLHARSQKQEAMQKS